MGIIWRTPTAACIAAVGLTTSLQAAAIITRHDVPDSDYVVPDSDYPQVVDLFQPGDCQGTLIAPTFLLTAAHCAEDINIPRPLRVDGVDYFIADVILHPQWGGGNYDIALIRFQDPVQGVTPFPLYRNTDEEGQMMTLVGRGLHATGLEGERGGSMDQQLRRATNVVSGVNEHWLEVFFESPNDAGITALEGVGAAGDSGGPAFIENKDGIFLAGLNSWGDAFPYSDIGKYGAWDYSTRVSSYLQWIDSEAGTGPTEPGTPTDDTGTPSTNETDTDTTPEDETDAPSGQGNASAGQCGCHAVPGSGLPLGWGTALLLGMVGVLTRRNTHGREAPVRYGQGR